MTDRVAGFVVVLEQDVRDDELEATLNALRMVRGVLGVEPLVSEWQLHVATARTRAKLDERLTAWAQDLHEALQ